MTSSVCLRVTFTRFVRTDKLIDKKIENESGCKFAVRPKNAYNKDLICVYCYKRVNKKLMWYCLLRIYRLNHFRLVFML